MATVSSLVQLLQTTPSPVSLLKHTDTVGIPHYFIEAIVGHSGHFHPQPWSDGEVRAIGELRRVRAPPAGDEVANNILIGSRSKG